MNFLLDENFPKSARAVLESAGHEVLDFRSLGIIGSPDEAVVRMALEKSAAILTTDRDFFHTLGRQYPANGVRCHISTNSGDVFINRLLSAGVHPETRLVVARPRRRPHDNVGESWMPREAEWARLGLNFRDPLTCAPGGSAPPL